MDSSEVATTPEARKIVARSMWGSVRGSSIVIMRMLLGSERINMRTKVVLPAPDGPESTQIEPERDRADIKRPSD